METDKPHPSRTLSVVALVLSVIAIGIALYTELTGTQQSVDKDAEYRRVVRDVWAALEPMHHDYGLDTSGSPPSTIQEALEPLVRASTTLGPGNKTQGP